MGFVKSLVTGKVAKPTTNTFQAKGATLDNASYGDAIQQAQANALAVNPQQQSLADALRAASEGRGPSVAENQLKQTTDQNVQQTAGLIASTRGLNPALAARLAAKAGADANLAAAGQGATLRAQEQIAARGQLADVLGGMAQGATSLAGTAGTLQNQQNTTRVQNVLGTEGINAGVATGNQNAAMEAQKANAGFQGAILGGLASGVGAALAKAEGGEIPGRPRVRGDHPANDTVPILASPGEIVLPRTVAQADDAPERAAEFVAAIKAKKGGDGYGKVLARTRELEARFARLERLGPDVDLGAKREADLPDDQLPVYRGEAAKVMVRPMGRMNEGGEVGEPSLVDALKAWWRSEGGNEKKSRDVAEAAHAKLPDALSARGALEKKRAQLRQIDAALAEN
jgi:hypothetical protein